MRVKEFMELYSDSNFHFMTSKGYLFLNSDQVKSILLEGQKEAAKKELGKGIRADELLAGEVISVSWKSYKISRNLCLKRCSCDINFAGRRKSNDIPKRSGL